MRICFRSVVNLLLTATLFSACSRPYVTYQKMPVEQFTNQAKAPGVAPSLVMTPSMEVGTPTSVVYAAEAFTSLTQAAALKAAKQSLQEVIVHNSNHLASNKRLEKRMTRVQNLLMETSKRVSVESVALRTSHKMTLVERLIMKKIDKKIKKSMGPEATKALDNLTRVGVILALIGLVLALIPGVSLVGVLLLVAGLVLILLGLLEAV